MCGPTSRRDLTTRGVRLGIPPVSGSRLAVCAASVSEVEPPTTVDDYDPEWPRWFATIREYLERGLPAGPRVEHVGSTAVPGLPAKSIIDLDVVVTTADRQLSPPNLA